MDEVVYAIKISNMEYSGLKILDVKIGKSSDIENTLSQYSRGVRDPELLDMWKPNPEKTYQPPKEESRKSLKNTHTTNKARNSSSYRTATNSSQKQSTNYC